MPSGCNAGFSLPAGIDVAQDNSTADILIVDVEKTAVMWLSFCTA